MCVCLFVCLRVFVGDRMGEGLLDSEGVGDLEEIKRKRVCECVFASVCVSATETHKQNIVLSWHYCLFSEKQQSTAVCH